jgi:tRNA-intron endonuclease
MPFTGILIQNRIITWGIEESRSIFNLGYYGKPVGISKPKGTDFESPLVLDLIEGCYLVNIKLLDVRHFNGKKIYLKEMKSICRVEYIDFDMKYAVFKKLRDLGYIVTPGIKFGCDFAVYEHATSIVLAGRLATTVRKQFILAVSSMSPKAVEFIGFDWWRA